MTFLPLVERELRIAARLVGTYRIRTMAAGIVTLVAMAMLVFGTFSSRPSQVGKPMFHTLSYLTMVLCFLEGARKTADCLSEERREGTLGLLFLTDLRGYDVVLGKLVAASINSFYCLFALLPILALSLLLGGVLFGEFWRMSLALGHILFFSLAAGIWVSAQSRLEARALIATLVFILALLSIHNWFPGSFEYSPSYSYYSAFEPFYRVDPGSFWKSLLFMQGLSWVLLVWASLILPRRFQDEFARVSSDGVFSRLWRRWQLGSDPQREHRRKEMLDLNPAYWLAGRNVGRRLVVWLPVTIVGGIILVFSGFFTFSGVFPLIYFSVVVNFFLKVWIAFQSCHCLAEARRNNALEMMLSSPLTVDQIIRGQLLSLKRIFLFPVITILGVQLLAVIAGLYLLPSGQRVGPIALSSGFLAVYLSLFALDVAALIWSGMWFGLTSKNETVALFKSVGLILIAPTALLLFWCFGIVLYIGWPIFFIAWSSTKLRAEFRKIATERFNFAPRQSGWFPFFEKKPPLGTLVPLK